MTARAAEGSSDARVTMQFLRDGRCNAFCVEKGTTALLLRVNAAMFLWVVRQDEAWQFWFKWNDQWIRLGGMRADDVGD